MTMKKHVVIFEVQGGSDKGADASGADKYCRFLKKRHRTFILTI